MIILSITPFFPNENLQNAGKLKEGAVCNLPTTLHTLVKSSRIYTGQYTFPMLLLNDDNMLGEHKLREKNIVYGRLF